MDLTSYLLGKNSSSGGGGGDLTEYFDTEITSNTTASNSVQLQNIVKKTPPLTIADNVTSLQYCFRYWPNTVELDFSQFDTKNITRMDNMFNTCYKKVLKLPFNTKKVQYYTNMFENSSVVDLDLSSFELREQYGNEFNGMFKNAYFLAKLDISKMDSTYIHSNFTNMFQNCGQVCKQSDGAYAEGIPYVYVKDVAMQTWILTYNNGCPDEWSTDNVVVKQ